jgi:hypothetical protein
MGKKFQKALPLFLTAREMPAGLLFDNPFSRRKRRLA